MRFNRVPKRPMKTTVWPLVENGFFCQKVFCAFFSSGDWFICNPAFSHSTVHARNTASALPVPRPLDPVVSFVSFVISINRVGSSRPHGGSFKKTQKEKQSQQKDFRSDVKWPACMSASNKPVKPCFYFWGLKIFPFDSVQRSHLFFVFFPFRRNGTT